MNMIKHLVKKWGDKATANNSHCGKTLNFTHQDCPTVLLTKYLEWKLYSGIPSPLYLTENFLAGKSKLRLPYWYNLKNKLNTFIFMHRSQWSDWQLKAVWLTHFIIYFKRRKSLCSVIPNPKSLGEGNLFFMIL